MRGLRQLYMARVRRQRQEFGHGLWRDQVTATAADQQQRALHLARGLGQCVLVLFAVAGQFGYQTRVPVPAPAAVAVLAQQRTQRLLGFARTVRHVGRDHVGGLGQRREAVGMGGHEGQDAFDTGGIPARGDVDQHHRREQTRPARLGQQAEQAAHRGRDQHRRAWLFTGQHDQVIGELFAVIRQVSGIPVRVAVATRVVGQGLQARGGQCAGGGDPGMTGLAEAMCEQHPAAPAVIAGGRCQTRAMGSVQVQIMERSGSRGRNHT